MPTMRTGFTAIAAATLLVGATTAVAAQSDASTASPASSAVTGVEHLRAQVDLPAGAWTNTPVEVTLPRSGTYELDADVRGRLAGVPPINTYITARLWNVTSGTTVPTSERLVNQIIDNNAGNTQAGGNQTAPISEVIRVKKATTIRLQAQRIDAVGTATVGQVYSDVHGYTALRYKRVGS
ncbi:MULTISPECIES: hypothetical protein [unclassified Streptomyces]|uniref:hypothetical protein n=1 Tax=unclassified Streptomyces TaxID=2593676 RepID=UPI00225AB9EA|nr:MULTISPECIES: hypothetical protein [unclassified Streptomyces]WSP56470.1 hypothetical protein OG306_20475 [Streptomyces sp. NBC_01241]WSU22812.1 hypothetical protein OG508_18765 [Streptomyces sp. NBC_01108]MCX4788207.1 hypothetical protein [Streptomyces sp. NBC_01221]MCX4796034.1 hypothetical protein [Streptomyces sp. NBC_01242]WSJ37302.1 hypothetical protein OG772_15455 [Streptomyces sp. NBC_01321]